MSFPNLWVFCYPFFEPFDWICHRIIVFPDELAYVHSVTYSAIAQPHWFQVVI